MKLSDELSADLESHRDDGYAAFHSVLIKCDKSQLIGVRTPALRSFAKKYAPRIEELFCLDDDRYEVKFIKLAAAAMLSYEEFLKYLPRCLPLIDNWALCDMFKPLCIKKNREDFRPYIDNLLSDGREYYQRFALTSLLSFYVVDEYIDYIFGCTARADCSKYYVRTAVAWLICEVIVKRFERGVSFLKRGTLDAATHNMAIRKSTESYRLDNDQKNYLKSLKR